MNVRCLHYVQVIYVSCGKEEWVQEMGVFTWRAQEGDFSIVQYTSRSICHDLFVLRVFGMFSRKEVLKDVCIHTLVT
jgi:hypothetical protein